MKISGVICEFNPFHRGHHRLFDLIRAELGTDTPIVCVMSGNYVQRGVPASWDKFTRAAAAIACGADVVLELPLTAVLRSAEGFASAGVEILSRFGSVTHLCFGSEQGDAATFTELAAHIDTPEYAQTLKTQLDLGLSYAAARQAAAGDLDGLMSQPNNILGLEYCLAIKRQNSPLIPLTFRRNGDYHATEPDEQEPSASSIRANLETDCWQTYLPEKAADLFSSAPRYDFSWGERAVLARLRTMTENQWETAAHGSEGLWRKAMKAAGTCNTVEEVLQTVKSKRYPMTRIQRLILCAYLGISEQDLKTPIPYVRILAASSTGRRLLRQAKENENLPLVNPGQTPENREYYRLETQAADLFTLFSAPGSPTLCGTEQAARISL